MDDDGLRAEHSGMSWFDLDVEYRARAARNLDEYRHKEAIRLAKQRSRHNAKLLFWTAVLLVGTVWGICEILYYWG